MIDEHESESNFQHAVNVWNTFKCKTIGDYSDLYLKTDVLLLADIFENFRKTLIETHKLDPAHYFTLPGFTWEAALKYTRIKLHLLTDIDMVMLIERGIRGGLSQCSNRYSEANNKYMPNYNPNEISKYIVYWDSNNLYAFALSQYLPTGGFKWVENLNNFEEKIEKIEDDSDIGYILEVDLHYPDSIHDIQKDLPMCPEKACPKFSKEPKLLATLYDKERYIIHYRNLKQALKHGVVLKKIHRVLEFKQSPWLNSYIYLNTDLRKQAKNNFEKNLFKLMNNAVFGKTMENVRKRVDVHIKTNWKGRYGVEALLSKPNFHRHVIFNENLIAIEMSKICVTIDKPIYIGMCVLDISKTLMYAFHYEYVIPNFKEKVKLLYTDTDSFIYEFKCDDIYSYIKRDIHLFDTSDYPPNNVYNIPLRNKKVIGLFKNEISNYICIGFCSLRSKLYSLKLLGADDKKTAKGIKKCVVSKTINFDDYVACLKNESELVCEQNSIRSKHHNVFSIKERKIALSPFDNKRYLIKNSTDTLPWGHKDIMDMD